MKRCLAGSREKSLNKKNSVVSNQQKSKIVRNKFRVVPQRLFILIIIKNFNISMVCSSPGLDKTTKLNQTKMLPFEELLKNETIKRTEENESVGGEMYVCVRVEGETSNKSK